MNSYHFLYCMGKQVSLQYIYIYIKQRSWYSGYEHQWLRLPLICNSQFRTTFGLPWKCAVTFKKKMPWIKISADLYTFDCQYITKNICICLFLSLYNCFHLCYISSKHWIQNKITKACTKVTGCACNEVPLNIYHTCLQYVCSYSEEFPLLYNG